MSGTIGFSMSQQLDEFGKPLSGGLLYFIQAGTTSTPQNAYQDSNLTIPLPNPIILDQAGRIPQFYLADGAIKIRLTDSSGVQQLVADNVLVIGPSSGSGGGGTVDATTVLATGDLKIRWGTDTLSGFVRGNGRTIGSSTSGATERANADCQALFEYLWGADANLTVSGGRGASANADWTANKTITLPDFRDRAIAGMGTMGNSAAGLLDSTYFGNSSLLGGKGGSASRPLSTTNLPPYTPSGSIHTDVTGTIPVQGCLGGTQVLGTTQYGCSNGGLSTLPITAFASSTWTGTAQGGNSTPFSVVQPTIVVTVYVKL